MTAAAPSSRRDARAALPAALDRRFEAVVFDWEGTAVSDRRTNASAVRRALEGLCAVGMDAYVVTGTDVGSVDSQLAARPRGPGRLYLCLDRGSEVFVAGEQGFELAAWRPLGEAAVRIDAKPVETRLTDEAEAARWVFADLWRRGVSPALVLVAGNELGSLGALPAGESALAGSEHPGPTVVSVGPEPTGVPSGVVHLGGGPDAFLALLEDQLERRERLDVPEIADDEGWTLAVDGLDPELERVREALLTLADGRIGTNGSPAWSHPLAAPRVLAAGVYDGEGPATELLAAPYWQVLGGALPDGARLRRRLDLRSGLLRQTLVSAEEEAAALAFSSLARPGTVALRAAGPASLVSGGGSLRAAPGTNAEQGRTDEGTFMLVPASRGGVAAAASEAMTAGRVERLGAYVSAPDALPDAETAVAALADARRAGFEALLRDHRAAWAQRWEDADVVVRGDQELQLAVRFALFHLMSSVASSGEAAVGARGLAGPGYRGHVFWDTDVFVLPFLAATHPRAARAILEYRIRRLPTAMRAASDLGLAGARFAWESALDGVDVTPPSARDPTGRIVRIRTGESEEHVVADVAWAASCYLDWTGDEEFAAGPGFRLLVETARYWASRARFDRDGRAHVYGVIGPDEYHEPVDDNAYTNVMARWNLRRAADAAARYGGVADGERERWLDTAAALVDGYDESNGLYEEFAGFYGLEPLVVADLAPRRPIAADLLLGCERVRGAQVVKQADVLMLHHLVPDEVKPGSLEANLAFYEPRTAHGSSLSPAIHASLFARAGRLGRAVQMLRIAAAIDLEDLTGTTASGLHLATMGGLWQALAFGFAGLRPRGETLVVDPRLPDGWDELQLCIRFRGARGRVRVRHEGVTVEGDHGLRWEEARR